MIILNDHLSAIENDPLFGQKVADAVRSVGCYDKGVDINGQAATVIETHHADNQHVIVVGGNYAQDMGVAAHWTERLDMTKPEDRVKLIKNLAEREGYFFEEEKRKTMKLVSILVVLVVGAIVSTVLDLGFHVQKTVAYYVLGMIVGMIVENINRP